MIFSENIIANMKDDFIKNVSAAKVPSMFWLAGTVTVEQKDAVNSTLYKKVFLKGVLILKLVLKKVTVKSKYNFKIWKSLPLIAS